LCDFLVKGEAKSFLLKTFPKQHYLSCWEEEVYAELWKCFTKR